jgi:phosphoglycerol transferase MdoB-like AlkP superfamily enzyme
LKRNKQILLLALPISFVLAAVFILGKGLSNGIVSGKYFWFYVSMALLSILAIPVYITRCRERITFKLSDLLLLLFCLATILITLHHGQTDKQMPVADISDNVLFLFEDISYG